MVKKGEIVNWDAKEYIPHEKNTGWYVGLVIVCLALVALSIIFGSWTFAILVVLYRCFGGLFSMSTKSFTLFVE